MEMFCKQILTQQCGLNLPQQNQGGVDASSMLNLIQGLSNNMSPGFQNNAYNMRQQPDILKNIQKLMDSENKGNNLNNILQSVLGQQQQT